VWRERKLLSYKNRLVSEVFSVSQSLVWLLGVDNRLYSVEAICAHRYFGPWQTSHAYSDRYAAPRGEIIDTWSTEIHLHYWNNKSWDGSVGTATGCGLGFDFQQGQEIFPSSTASRPTLGPTQLPIQWLPGDLSAKVKRQGREPDHSPPSSAEVKNGRLVPPLPQTSSWRDA
jgi:hypothetical protein